MENDFHTNEKNDDLIRDPLESVMIKTENFEDEIVPKTDITTIHENIMNTSEARKYKEKKKKVKKKKKHK
jgi:hypothetical protein